MRVLIAFVLFFIILSACSPGRASDALPVPSEAVLALQSDDLYLSLQTLAGWHGYVERNHIILRQYGDALHAARNMTINIWIPDTPVLSETGLMDALRLVTGRMRSNPRIAISEPVRMEWSSHDAAYYLLNDGADRMSLIMALKIPDAQRMVALNISDVPADTRQIRTLLGQLFAQFTVNGVLLGADGFERLPETLHLPSMNP
jgi:hypothetical protein